MTCPIKLAAVAGGCVLMLAACAQKFTKVGASPEALRADTRECRREAKWAVPPPHPDLDGPTKTARDGIDVQTARYQYAKGYQQKVLTECMARRGYKKHQPAS